MLDPGCQMLRHVRRGLLCGSSLVTRHLRNPLPLTSLPCANSVFGVVFARFNRSTLQPFNASTIPCLKALRSSLQPFNASTPLRAFFLLFAQAHFLQSSCAATQPSRSNRPGAAAWPQNVGEPSVRSKTRRGKLGASASRGDMKRLLPGVEPESKRIIQILSAFNCRFIRPTNR